MLYISKGILIELVLSGLVFKRSIKGSKIEFVNIKCLHIRHNWRTGKNITNIGNSDYFGGSASLKRNSRLGLGGIGEIGLVDLYNLVSLQELAI